MFFSTPEGYRFEAVAAGDGVIALPAEVVRRFVIGGGTTRPLRSAAGNLYRVAEVVSVEQGVARLRLEATEPRYRPARPMRPVES